MSVTLVLPARLAPTVDGFGASMCVTFRLMISEPLFVKPPCVIGGRRVSDDAICIDIKISNKLLSILSRLTRYLFSPLVEQGFLFESLIKYN